MTSSYHEPYFLKQLRACLPLLRLEFKTGTGAVGAQGHCVCALWLCKAVPGSEGREGK